MPTYDIEMVIEYLRTKIDPDEFIVKLLATNALDYEELLWAIAEYIDGQEDKLVGDDYEQVELDVS